MVEAIACLLAIRDGVVPPTVNLDDPDEDCDLDYVPHTARDRAVDVAMSNSFGFGGQNTTLVLRRFLGERRNTAGGCWKENTHKHQGE